MNDIVIFKNISEEIFEWAWNAEKCFFAPGEERAMEQWKAQHFAKHLIDELLNKSKKSTNNDSERRLLLSQVILPVSSIDKPVEEIVIGAELQKKKRGRPKKDNEFEDL